MSKTPDPNSTGADGSKSTREEATIKVPSKDPKKKDDKKDEDLVSKLEEKSNFECFNSSLVSCCY